ncbi:MAG TPA: 30S ribosomal protein S6 [Atribacteraceae bacterium]|nr:30S ribosomal protein S6 [Atribacteraceae bacterium]
MKPYELGLVIKPNATDEDVRVTLEKIKTLITREGGVIERTNVWGKRRLASLIEKQTEGIYVFINFRTAPQNIHEITRVIRLAEMIIRHIIVKEEGKAIRPVQTAASQTPTAPQEADALLESPLEEGYGAEVPLASPEPQ